MIAALISATVALLIFAWTQWVTGLRSRHDLLRLKLEELCRCVVSLRGKVVKATCTHLPSQVDEQKNIVTQIQQSIVDDILMVQMLGSLYFPTMREKIVAVSRAAEMSIGHREYYGAKGNEVTEIQILVHAAPFQALRPNTDELLDYVNMEYANLTETPRARLTTLLGHIFG